MPRRSDDAGVAPRPCLGRCRPRRAARPARTGTTSNTTGRLTRRRASWRCPPRETRAERAPHLHRTSIHPKRCVPIAAALFRAPALTRPVRPTSPQRCTYRPPSLPHATHDQITPHSRTVYYRTPPESPTRRANAPRRTRREAPPASRLPAPLPPPSPKPCARGRLSAPSLARRTLNAARRLFTTTTTISAPRPPASSDCPKCPCRGQGRRRPTRGNAGTSGTI